MGLRHPESLTDWLAWSSSRRPVRLVVAASRTRLRPRSGERAQLPQWVVRLGGPAPRVLVAVDAFSPSNWAALLQPLRHLPTDQVAVLSPAGPWPDRHASSWRAVTVPPGLAAEVGPAGAGPGAPSSVASWLADTPALATIRVVLVAGHYLPLGAAGYALATRRGLPVVIVQHGLLTPHAPPLPAGAELLAWSLADADFWRSRRTDVGVRVVGSQLLWAATADQAQQRARHPVWAEWDGELRDRPVYLGQLHAAELARSGLAHAAYRFCRQNDAIYRPHPSEGDRVSRAIHAAWQRRGIRIDRAGRPIGDPPTPVVSVFSTGVLEAAARGLPAWVDHPNPPRWLVEFWSRYRMARWGRAPTPAPAQPITEPARLVAARLAELAEVIR